MNKKFLSLVLALVMVLGTFGSVFAETKAPEAKDAKKSEVKVPEKKDSNAKVQWLVDNGVVAGRTVNKDDKNADLALDKDIQRAEVTKLLIYAIGQQDLAKRLDGVYAPYKDVPSNHWANGLIAAGSTVASPANALPFLHGIGHNMFQPERQVRYDELAKMLVVLVKKDLTKDGLAAAKWPTDWMNWAAQLGIFDGIKTPVDGSKAAVRQDAFVMLYNALYKIGQLRNLPTGETMGIISDASFNKLTLNQGDAKKEFTVSANTNFVPNKYVRDNTVYQGISWVNEIGAGNYYIGSLVRVIADDKGNVSHIIQLGNPKDLALESQGWVGVAEKQVETLANEQVALGDLSELTVNKVKVTTNSATRYFVADYSKNQLTEVKNADAALALFDRANNKAKNVYVGYDVLKNSKINEAKVVVFNTVDKDNTNKDLVRVVTPGSNLYSLTAQKPGINPTEEKSYNLRDYKAGFPLNFGVEKYDVIDLYSDHAKMIIDYSEDNIYKVTKVEVEKITDITKVNGRKIGLTLIDKYNTEQKVDVVSDADFFFYSQLEKDAKVQVRFVKGAKDLAVDIVSVVPVNAELRGVLPRGVETDRVNGTVAKVTVRPGAEFNEITLYAEGSNRVFGETYVTREDVKDIKTGDVVTFVASKPTKETHNLPLAKGIVVKAVYDAKQKEILDINGAKYLTQEQKDQAAKEIEATKGTKAELDPIRAYYFDLNAQQGEAKKLEARSPIEVTLAQGETFASKFAVKADVSFILADNPGTKPNPAAKAIVKSVDGQKVTVEITRDRKAKGEKAVKATEATVEITIAK